MMWNRASFKVTKLAHRSWQVEVTYDDLVLETKVLDTKVKAEGWAVAIRDAYTTMIDRETDFWSRDHSDCATISRGIGDPVSCTCPVRDQEHLQGWYDGMAGTTTKTGLEVTENVITMLVRASLPYSHSDFEHHVMETVLLYLNRATEDLQRLTRPAE